MTKAITLMIRQRMMAWFNSQHRVAAASSAQGTIHRTEASQVEEAGVDRQVQQRRLTYSETQTCKDSRPLERAMECTLTFITSRGLHFSH